jgi:polyhydroxyalkanoate synthesis regulator phasin
MVAQVKEGIPTGTITKEEAQALIDQIKKDVEKSQGEYSYGTERADQRFGRHP